MESSSGGNDPVYGRFVCDWFSDFPAGFRMHYDFKLHSRNYGEGCSADEYVCGRYSDEGAGWNVGFIPYCFYASEDCRFYIHRNKADGGFDH